MSVILRKDGKVFIYCKGADTTVLDRIDETRNDKILECTHAHLNVRLKPYINLPSLKSFNFFLFP